MGKTAVAIVRVSSTKGRGGDSFHSPATQRDRIRSACESEGFELLDIYEELDISGGKPLLERPGLSQAIHDIEAGKAQVLVAAYLDRLTRSMRVREEVVERVEAAGGSVLTVDMGIQTNATASQWLSGTMGSAVSEFIRRTAAERSAVAQQRAIDRGVPPYTNTPPGYMRQVVGRRPNGSRMWGKFEIDPKTGPFVVEAFEARARGATIDSIRDKLTAQGVKRSYHGIQSMLTSRVYLGEIHFGEFLPNLEAHPALIDLDTWEAVQKIVVPRGRRAKSKRLLARLGIIRCGTCGSRMVVGTQQWRNYAFYRCPPTGDCPRRLTIAAHIAEGFVVDAIKEKFGHLEGTASIETDAQEAEATFHKAQSDLDAALRSFAGFEGEEAARSRLTELRELRDKAEERANHLGSLTSSYTLNLAKNWDDLFWEAQRAIITATIERVEVGPDGRGIERLSLAFRE